MNSIRTVLACSVVAAAGLAAPATADVTLSFNVFEDSGDPLNQTGLGLQVDVADAGSGKANFVFKNTSSGINAGAVMTTIYFENVPFAANLMFSQFIGNAAPAISFASGSGSLPGASNIGWLGNFFVGDKTSGPGGLARGLNSGEEITFQFMFLNGTTFADLISNLESNSGRMRIGAHVQSLDAGQSVGVVTNLVPAPGAAALLGLGGLLVARRRR